MRSVSRAARSVQQAFAIWTRGLRAQRLRRRVEVRDGRYNAFVSYSHVDELVAMEIRTALHRFVRRPGQLRALRIFVDHASMAAEPALWPALNAALDASEYLLILASPDAAKSPQVRRELAHWRDCKSPDNVLIVLVRGSIRSNDDGLDPVATTALPVDGYASLFGSEPRWTDLRNAAAARPWKRDHPELTAVISDLAPKLHHRDKDDLIGEDVRLKRRATRVARSVAALLSALLAATAVAAVLFVRERDTARRQTTEVTALALSSAAAQRRDRRPDLALLLAFEAFRSRDRGETRGQVVGALQAARDPGVLAILRAPEVPAIMAFSPSGGTLATVGAAGAVRLWDARTRQLVHTTHLRGERPITSVAFAPDGRRLAVAMEEEIVILDARTLRPARAPLRSPADLLLISALSFGPGQDTLVSGSQNGVLRWWDLRTGALVRKRLTPSGGREDLGANVAISQLATSVRAGLLAFVSGGEIMLQRARGGGSAAIVRARNRAAVAAVAFDPSGTRLTSLGSDGAIGRWSVPSLRPIGSAHSRAGSATNLKLSADGSAAAYAPVGEERGGLRPRLALLEPQTFSLRIRRTASRAAWSRLAPQRGQQAALALSPDGAILAEASSDSTIRLWDTTLRERLGTPVEPGIRHASSIAFGAGGLIATADERRGPTLWRLSGAGRSPRVTAAPLERLPVIYVRSLAFAPDGDLLASGDEHGTIGLWDVRTSRRLGPPIAAHASAIERIAFAPDARTFATLSFDQTMRLWRTRSQRPVGAPVEVPSGSTQLAFSPDGRTIAVAEPGVVRLRDARTLRPVAALHMGQADAGAAVAFSPSGSTLAVGRPDGALALWDVARRRQTGDAFTGHAGPVTALAFSPDGRTLASGGEDQTVRLWDVKTRSALGTPLHGPVDVSALAFTRGGRTLQSAGSDGVRLWDGLLWRDLGELRDEVCALVGSGLAGDEWRRIAPGVPPRDSCA